MESPSWPEGLPNNRIKAIRELNKGQEWTDKLRKALQWSKKTDSTSIDDVVVQIIAMFENTLSIMGSCSVNEPGQLPTSDLYSSCSSDGRKSEDHSPRTVIPVKVKRGCYKRRKNSWTTTKVTAVLIDDGHIWRKYGQKEIINTKHQRSYYRCTYKLDQGCLATKQVQMIEDKPPNYKITYFGHHTCTNLQRAPPIILDCPDLKDTSILLNFDTKGIREKKQIEPNFPTMKYEQSKGFPTSSNTYPSWDRFTHVPQIPLEFVPMMPSSMDDADMISLGLYTGLDYGDMSHMTSLGPYSSMASSQVYDMDHMFGMNDFHDFPV